MISAANQGLIRIQGRVERSDAGQHTRAARPRGSNRALCSLVLLLFFMIGTSHAHTRFYSKFPQRSQLAWFVSFHSKEPLLAALGLPPLNASEATAYMIIRSG